MQPKLTGPAWSCVQFKSTILFSNRPRNDVKPEERRRANRRDWLASARSAYSHLARHLHMQQQICRQYNL